MSAALVKEQIDASDSLLDIYKSKVTEILSADKVQLDKAFLDIFDLIKESDVVGDENYGYFKDISKVINDLRRNNDEIIRDYTVKEDGVVYLDESLHQFLWTAWTDLFTLVARYFIEKKEHKSTFIEEVIAFFDITSLSDHSWGMEELSSDSEPEQEDEERNTESYLLFNIEDKPYVLCLKQVAEILQNRTIIPLPVRKQNLMGVINFRGSILPILNINEILLRDCDLKEVTNIYCKNNSANIIVVRIKSRRYGIPIVSITEILDIQKSMMQSAQNLELSFLSPVVTHMFMHDEKSVIVLDLERLEL